MSDRLVVEVHRHRTGVELLRFGSDRLECVPVRVGFHPKLANEPASQSLCVLVLFHTSMPDFTSVSVRLRIAVPGAGHEELTVPLVDIADSRIRSIFAIPPRACGMIGNARVLFLYNLREKVLVQVASWEG